MQPNGQHELCILTKELLNQTLSGHLACSHTSMLSRLTADTGILSSWSVWLAVVWLLIFWFWQWMMQVCSSVVQHKTCTDDLAGFGWCNTQFSMQAVPSTLNDTNAALNCASCAAVCRVVCFFLWLRINDWCQQPVTQHVATVTQDEARQWLILPFEI